MKILILIIIGVAVVGFLLFNKGADSPEPSQEQNGVTSEVPAPGNEYVDEMIVVTATTVTYTDEGFSPKAVTIPQGGTIRFVNESSHEMWVASADHPTHIVYPETTGSDCIGSAFDGCRSLSNGESWEFTFNQVGEWGYHNHKRVSQLGTIIVK